MKTYKLSQRIDVRTRKVCGCINKAKHKQTGPEGREDERGVNRGRKGRRQKC